MLAAAAESRGLQEGAHVDAEAARPKLKMCHSLEVWRVDDIFIIRTLSGFLRAIVVCCSR